MTSGDKASLSMPCWDLASPTKNTMCVCLALLSYGGVLEKWENLPLEKSPRGFVKRNLRLRWGISLYFEFFGFLCLTFWNLGVTQIHCVIALCRLWAMKV